MLWPADDELSASFTKVHDDSGSTDGGNISDVGDNMIIRDGEKFYDCRDY